MATLAQNVIERAILAALAAVLIGLMAAGVGWFFATVVQNATHVLNP